MTKNPFINAGAAAAYIGAVVLLIGQLEAFDGPETLLVPLAMISLLVLSVLVMGYALLLQPLQLYLDGHKKEGVALLGNTVLVFAGIVVVLFGVMLFSIQ